jgi:hypothetical protein
MTLGGFLAGEQVWLRAVDGGGLWDLTEIMDDRHLKKDPLAAVNLIHYSSSDTDILPDPNLQLTIFLHRP